MDGTRIAILQEAWFSTPGVGADEIACLAALALHADKDGICWPSQATLGRLLKRSRPWVNKVVARLAELGIIEKTHRSRSDGGDRSCLYRLTGEAARPVAAAAPPPSEPDSGANTRSHGGDSGKAHLERNQETLSARATARSDDRPGNDVPAVDWQPGDAALSWAVARFPTADLAAHVERFVTKSRAKGYRFRDVDAGWQSWLLQDMNAESPTSDARSRPWTPNTVAAHSRFTAWAAAARTPSRTPTVGRTTP